MSIEVTLIQEIEKHPCLYNFYLHEYNKKEILDDKWAVIADNCDLTIPECKDKWKNIRSSFVRSLKLSSMKTKKPYYLSSYLQFIIPFLKSCAEFNSDDTQYTEGDSNDNMSTVCTIKIEPDIDFDANQIDSETNQNKITAEEVRPNVPASHPRSTFLRKRKRMPTVSTKNQTTMKNFKIRQIDAMPATNTRADNNAMRLFLMSLLPEFDDMDDDQLRMFKIKVMMLIDDIKTQCREVKEDIKFNNDRLQKRLIDLLLKNLEQKT